MPRIVTYCRFATPMPPERIAGIERQLAALVASLPEHALIGAFHDQGVSGLSLPDDRPGFQALLSTTSPGTARSCWTCWRPSRPRASPSARARIS